ncbi:probable G-protein coupled receptor Mth-like 1 isoform X2 [Periplaneta americana]|uniref:probable G-protein coupled receptor Mth-like 1 isoform X2 n=1 Tax=Periplaneta americana TaxID=6978 RepID=UPI0037E707CB
MRWVCRWHGLAVFVLALLSGARCRINSNTAEVILFKCCPHGEVLAENNECKPSGGAGSPWTPLVYSPARRAFLEHGTTPLHWRIVDSTKPKCKNGCDVVSIRSHPQAPAFLLFDNGSLLMTEVSKILEPGSFCVDAGVALVCADDNCVVHESTAPQSPSDTVSKQVKARVKKCCGEGAVYSDAKSACVVLSSNNEDTMANFSLRLESQTIVLTTGFPACGTESAHDLVVAGKLDDPESEFKADGSLHLPAARITLRPGEFCVEHFLEHPGDKVSVFTCHGNLPSRNERRQRDWDLRFALYPIGLFLSVFFLAATLAAGCLLPSSHHMLHWKCQTGHVACLLVGDLLLAITQLADDRVSGGFCTTIAISMHFFFLAAFFWLNTMCFNIWWTFRDLRPASLDKSQETFRLRLYQLYAWGGPLLIAGVAAILDNLPEESYSSFLRPRFGQQRCWFYGDVEIFPYFYGPVGVLLLINMLLFAATARELTCGLWKREVVKSNTERATLGRVCLKLVVVMGLTWMADVISWAVGGPHYIWYVTDLINALQGVFIFIVAGCQPQVWSAINRLWCLRPQHNQRTNMGQHMSLYSQGPPSLGDSVTNNHSTKTAHLETLC